MFCSKVTNRYYTILEKPKYIIVEFWPLMTLNNISFEHELVARTGFIPSYGIFQNASIVLIQCMLESSWMDFLSSVKKKSKTQHFNHSYESPKWKFNMISNNMFLRLYFWCLLYVVVIFVSDFVYASRRCLLCSISVTVSLACVISALCLFVILGQFSF